VAVLIGACLLVSTWRKQHTARRRLSSGEVHDRAVR